MEAKYLCYLPIMVGIYMTTFHIWRRLQGRPPRPFLCFPVIGHFLMLYFPLAESLSKVAEKYGPVVFMEFGWTTNLSVCSPSAAEECLGKNDVIFCNRPKSALIGRYLGNNFSGINFSPYGPHWRNLRRISATELLSPQRLQSPGAILIRSDEVSLLIQRLYAKVNNHLGLPLSSEVAGAVVDLRPELYDLPIRVMTKLLFGKRYEGSEAKKLAKMVTDFLTYLTAVNFGDDVPYLRWLDRGRERRLGRFKQEREAIMRDCIDDYLREIKPKLDTQSHDSTVNKPMVQVLLELHESQPEYYKDDIIYIILLDLLVGATDSSATTMEWVLSLLLNHPEVLNKAREEIDGQVGHERFVDDSDLKHLPYLACIIKETLRMYPPIPTLFPHESSEDCIVKGYRVPRGTTLDINVWAIHNDPKIWDDPLSFRPERFAGVEGYRVGFKMMPFGAGRRICPGEGLATRVLGLAIASLIQCFDWHRVDHKPVDMAILPDVFVHRVEPLQARLRPRQPMIKLLTQIQMHSSPSSI